MIRKARIDRFIRNEQQYLYKTHVLQKKTEYYLYCYSVITDIIKNIVIREIFIEEIKFKDSYSNITKLLMKYHKVALQDRTTRYYNELKTLSVEIHLINKQYLLT